MPAEAHEADGPPSGWLSGAELEAEARLFLEELAGRLALEQNGVPTFFDSLMRILLRAAPSRLLPDQRGLVQRFLTRRRMGRFVDYFARRAVPISEIPVHVLAMSQGTSQCLTWRQRPLFKTVFDFALFPVLLQESRPKTIVEIGSGSGASALWLGDLGQALDLDYHVFSLDIRPPALSHPRVTYLRGDCHDIGATFDRLQPERLRHPWLVVEDAHVNVGGVMAYFDGFLQTDDYLVIEDLGPAKEPEVEAFLSARPGKYLVDTRYTDFFGWNATCCGDSIFRHT